MQSFLYELSVTHWLRDGVIFSCVPPWASWHTLSQPLGSGDFNPVSLETWTRVSQWTLKPKPSSGSLISTLLLDSWNHRDTLHFDISLLALMIIRAGDNAGRPVNLSDTIVEKIKRCNWWIMRQIWKKWESNRWHILRRLFNCFYNQALWLTEIQMTSMWCFDFKKRSMVPDVSVLFVIDV